MKNSPLPLKVCGLTRAEDVRLCLELGVSFTGFIFAPASPRRISAAAAAALPSGGAARVGVFMNQSAEEIKEVMKTADLDYAQLHGGENESLCLAVGPERVIKVLWPQKPGFAKECEHFSPFCAMFLLDSGLYGGGSGTTLGWDALRSFKSPRPWLLAGGLGPENAAKALAACAPHALDCNSALEDAPGLKNHQKLKELAAALSP